MRAGSWQEVEKWRRTGKRASARAPKGHARRRERGPFMNTRTIAVIALIIAVIVLLLLIL
jgi:hypothetical protein